MTKTLQDYAEESKRQDEMERGKKDFYQTPDGIEAKLRILEWLGHIPCWIEGHVHYIKTGEGTKMLTCGEEECYSCGRLADMAADPNLPKNDAAFVKDATKKRKRYLFVIDWDNRSKGPQLWEPKDTQNCATWPSLRNLFTKVDEYGSIVFEMGKGLLISLLIVKEKRNLKSGTQEIHIQKSFATSRNFFPIKFKKNQDGSPYQDADGNFTIGIPMPDKTIQAFKLPDLGKMMPAYDEEYHRECWGDEAPPAPGDEYAGEGFVDTETGEVTDQPQEDLGEFGDPGFGNDPNGDAGGDAGFTETTEGGEAPWGDEPSGEGGDDWGAEAGGDAGFDGTGFDDPGGDPDGEWNGEATGQESTNQTTTPPPSRPPAAAKSTGGQQSSKPAAGAGAGKATGSGGSRKPPSAPKSAGGGKRTSTPPRRPPSRPTGKGKK